MGATLNAQVHVVDVPTHVNPHVLQAVVLDVVLNVHQSVLDAPYHAETNVTIPAQTHALDAPAGAHVRETARVRVVEDAG